MFVCDKCKKDKMTYDYKEKTFKCSNCKTINIVKPKKSRCSCGNVYEEYTWFDPSSCQRCNQSFID